jgi:hypothetical protein
MILPFTSVIAAIVGVVLIFWRFIVNQVKKVYRLVFGRAASARPADGAAQDNPEVNGSAPMGPVSGEAPLSDVAKP